MNAPLTVEPRDYRSRTGEKFPGVTDVIADCRDREAVERLTGWANGLGWKHESHTAVRNRAANVGHETHDFVAKHLRGQPTKELGVYASRAEEKAFIAYRKWAAWWPTSGLIATAVEAPLIDYELGYGGTIDALFKRGTHAVVGDLKSGKQPHHEVIIQLGAYTNLLFKNGVRPSSGLVMHSPVEGEMSVIEIPFELLMQGLSIFLAMLSIYKLRPSLRLPAPVKGL